MFNKIVYYSEKSNAENEIQNIIQKATKRKEEIIQFSQSLTTLENIYKIINENKDIKQPPRTIIIDDYIEAMQDLLYDQESKEKFIKLMTDFATFLEKNEELNTRVILIVNQNNMHKSLMLANIENKIKIKTFVDDVPLEYCIYI